MAADHDIQSGDSLDILDEAFSVVGLSDGTNSWMASFFFIQKQAAERLLLTPDAASFVLLTLEPDADETAVSNRLNQRLDSVEVVPAAVMPWHHVDFFPVVLADVCDIRIARFRVE